MIKTKQDFQAQTNAFWSKQNSQPFAFAIGRKYFDSDKNHIATRFLSLNVQTSYGTLAAILMENNIVKLPNKIAQITLYSSGKEIARNMFTPFSEERGHKNLNALKALDLENCCILVYPTEESLLEESTHHSDMLCRLSLLSACLLKPGQVNIAGAFGLLETLYYTTSGVYTPEDWEEKFISDEKLDTLLCVDKFPPMHWSVVIPKGVRIADVARVRVGASLGKGVTVMHEGFANLKTYIEGPNMIEGRPSAGVSVGAHTQIGGGASVMGTLSGGTRVISIGEYCLLGANSGLGISLGDCCTVEAGLYVTEGKKIYVTTSKIVGVREGDTVKAEELSGLDNMLFIQNSTNGKVELHYNEKAVRLNKALH